MFMGKEGMVWFMSVAEDVDSDPLKLGRCKIRCVGYHTPDKGQLPTADLPWAMPMVPVTSASMQGVGVTPLGLVEGTWVIGFFRDGTDGQEPVIMGSVGGIPEELPKPAEGFNAPDGTYPSSSITSSGHGINEADTNRLAKADSSKEHAALANKKAAYSASNKTGNITATPTANSGTAWSEPTYSSVHVPVYPKNRVMETESGHIVEHDDTTGKTRINHQHKSGTFEETHDNGDKVTRVVGNHFEVVVGNDNVLIKGSCNITIDANCKTYIKGNWDIQVDGNKTEVIAGTSDETVTGAVNETYNSTKSETVAGGVTETYGATQITIVAGALTITGATIDLN